MFYKYLQNWFEVRRWYLSWQLTSGREERPGQAELAQTLGTRWKHSPAAAPGPSDPSSRCLGHALCRLVTWWPFCFLLKWFHTPFSCCPTAALPCGCVVPWQGPGWLPRQRRTNVNNDGGASWGYSFRKVLTELCSLGENLGDTVTTPVEFLKTPMPRVRPQIN